MCESPGIVVTNFRDKSGNVVSYPFPIIRGYVSHPGGAEVAKIKVSLTSGEPESEWPVSSRKFRGVVSLNLGKNVISLVARAAVADTHSSISTNVIIFYEPAQNCQYFVLPLYVICADSDGKFQSEDDEDDSLDSGLRRIETGAGLLQSFTAEKLVDEGFPRKTFRLHVDRRGRPRCSLFRTRLKRQEMYAMTDMQVWKHLKKEITRTFPEVRHRCKFLAFLADTRYSPVKGNSIPFLYEDMLRNTKGHVALGGSSSPCCPAVACRPSFSKALWDSSDVGPKFLGLTVRKNPTWNCASPSSCSRRWQLDGDAALSDLLARLGLALCSTACLYTWPEVIADLPRRLQDESPINRRKFMDDSAYRGTRWACFSTTLGAACHELGHAFNLGHTSAGLMARGFDNIYKEFTVARPAQLSVTFTTPRSRISLGPQIQSPLGQENSLNSLSDPKVASDHSNMDVVSSNPEPTLDVAAADAPVKSKDKTLAAKVSGTLQSRFFPLKRKESKSDKCAETPKFAEGSPVPVDDGFSTSSCAISLYDPDCSHMESRSASAVSTRPSSTISGSKKGGSWHRRISMGIKSPSESCTEEVAHISRPTLTPTFNYGPAPQTVVTKHYTRQVIYVPSGDLSGEFPLQRHGSSATLPPQLPSQQEKHKSAWKKLFGLKKKDKTRGSNNDVSNEISEELPAQMTEITEKPEVQNPSDERTIVSVVPPAKSLIISSDHVASRAGSESVVNTMEIPFLKIADTSTSVDGVFFDSEDEIFEPKSPDSMEEFSFKFGSHDSRVKAMGVALSPDVICELKQLFPLPPSEPPPARTSLAERRSSSRDVLSEQEEAGFAEKGTRKEPPKPRPTVRSRNGKTEEFVEPRVKAALTGHKSLDYAEKKTPVKDKSRERLHENFRSKKVDTKTEMRRKSASVEHGLDGESAPQRTAMTRFRSTVKLEKKEPTKTFERRSGSADNVLERRKPIRKDHKSSAEPSEEKFKQDSGIEQTSETDVETSEGSEKKMAHPAAKKVMSDDAGKSKLRFPLRTRAGLRQTNEVSEQEKIAVRNRIPLQSTQSSRNKENKSTKTSTTVKKAGSEKRRTSLTTSDPRRSSLRRRTSGKKHPSAKLAENSQKRSGTESSTRLDFQKVHVLTDRRPIPAHNRSRSRDSIGNIAGFINTDAESSKDGEEIHDWDGSQDLPDGMISPTPGSSNGESESSGGRKVVNRKQHCSSLINTASGISVMEDTDVPHRLPGPTLPVVERSNEGSSVSDPNWTKNCAALLNYHKWFNDEDDDDINAPPELKGDTLFSSAGIRLVELRDLCGNILQHWEFMDDVVPHFFKVVLPKPSSESVVSHNREMVIVALDTYGNLMDKTIQSSSF